MKVNVNGDIKEISLIYGIADNRATDWTKETIDVVSDGIKDEEGYPIIREKDFAILKKIENELKKNNEFSFYMPFFFSLQELYYKMVNENKERLSLQSNRVARLVKAAIRKEAEETNKVKSVHIDSVEVDWIEGPAKDTRFEKGKKYSYAEFQSLANKFDYKVYNEGSYMGGYDKMGIIADITITYEDGRTEKTQFEDRIDLGDGKITYDAINLKYILEQKYKATVDNPTVPYQREEYVKEFGTWENNADEYLKTKEFKLPEYPDYSKKTISEIGVGDIFRGGNYAFYKVIKRTPSSVYVEQLPVKRISKEIKDTREKRINWESYVVIDEQGEFWGSAGIDTSKPLRLRTYSNSGTKVMATQGRETLYAWDGKFYPDRY